MGRIHVDVRRLDEAGRCDLVGEAMSLLEAGDSLHLTLGHPPECVRERARLDGAADGLDLKLVEDHGRTWKVRVRRFGDPNLRRGTATS